jgi:acetaldehyde dehydrogenase (acetylating)
MVQDLDLLSVQEARTLLKRAREAWNTLGHFSQQKIDRVVAEAAKAASEASLELAKMAVEETGYGVVEHKFVKNKFASVDVYQFIKDMKTVGVIREVPERKLYEIAEPVGVIAAIIPSTNPTSTAIYKTLISLKARNTIVLSPHPAAKRCIGATADIMRKAALAAGAPDGSVECMRHVSIEGTQELMRNRQTSVILATGGMGLVRAAYSSGKPAFGVGPGNVPAYVESSADVAKAVGDILTGKSYDNGTLCCSEQALICDQGISQQVREEVPKQGGYFLTAEQVRAVERIAVTPARLANPAIVGKSAAFIAKQAGFTVPPGTRVLVAELEGVGREYPLSIEKLSPILAFYVVKDWREGCERSKQVLSYGGMGHTLSIHSQNQDVIMEFGLQKPAFRIIVNSPATHGAVGFSTGLDPAMTLGCGAYGGNITSDNITPAHLINTKRLAFEVRPVKLEAALAEYGYKEGAAGKPSAVTASVIPSVSPSVEQRVGQFLSSRGFPDRSTTTSSSSSGSPAGGGAFGGKPQKMDGSSNPSASPEASGEPAAKTAEPARALDFVSEEDVRKAVQEGRKLPIGPKTIVTPSARDLGNEASVFVRV